MTKNVLNDVCELTLDELDVVTAGTATWAQRLANEVLYGIPGGPTSLQPPKPRSA